MILNTIVDGNNITKPQKLFAQKAVILYSTNDLRYLLAQEHDIFSTDTGASLGPGRPVTNNLVESIVRMQGLEQNHLTLLPSEVIAISGKGIAWVVPGRVRPLAFRSSDKKLQAFDGVLLPQPHLLFVAEPGMLRVYALQSNERPTAETQLFRAPYLNVFQNNYMCRGNVPLPTEPDISQLKLYEDLFFLSNGTGGTISLPPEIPSYLKLLELSKEQGAFDPNWLVPLGITLKNVIKTVSTGENR